MGDTDSSEAQGSSGGITSAILEQLADFQRRVVLLEGATPRADVREAPASPPSSAPVVQGLAHPGEYQGSYRPPTLKWLRKLSAAYIATPLLALDAWQSENIQKRTRNVISWPV